VVYVPAGVPHAIGGGVLIAELQEPTDLSLVCEWKGYPIRPDDSHLGLGWGRALGALDLSAHHPVRTLPDEAQAFFSADRRAAPAGRRTALLVLDGEGSLGGVPAQGGDGFAVPASAESLGAAGDLRLLRCLAPDPMRQP